MASSRPPTSQPLRVLHLDTARSWRGGQQQVLLLHRELGRLGIRSVVLARSGGELAARLDELTGGAAPTLGYPWSPLTLRAVRRALRRVHVVHAHDARAAGIAVAAGGPGRRSPLLCHRRVSYPLHAGPLHRLKYRRVARWIAVGQGVQRVLVEAGIPPASIHVVPSAIDLDGFRQAAAVADPRRLRGELGLAEDDRVVGLTGALEIQKGHTVLLEAASRILEACPNVVFLWVGDGTGRRGLEAAAARSGVAPRLRMVGFRRDVASLTALYEVAVVPSVDGEGSSGALKEAMALGRPIVASNLEGNREVLGDAGLLVPVGDAGELAAAVIRVLAEPSLRGGLGRRAGRRAELFRSVRMATAIAAIYRELAGKGTAGVDR